jgi:hypothetical protein
MIKLLQMVCFAYIALSALSSATSFAAEDAKSIYLLGVTTSMAGITPPPGFYASSFTYLYGATATGNAALSRTLGADGQSLPSFISLETNAAVKAKAQVALDVLSALYVAPEKFLGGHVGFGLLLPIGYQSLDLNINALAALNFPNGTTLQRGNRFATSQNTFSIGDPLATAFIGWNAGHFHWKLTGLLNVPIGSYNKTNLVNMGFNHWAGDVTGSFTWLDPAIGLELSLAPGITFNAENPATNYRTGTEFHIEAAVMQHFSKDFAIGIAGYYYRQISGDSGAGALLGAFKGEVSALGPNIAYNFKISSVPIITSARWLKEFNAKNRMAGDAGFITITVPLGGHQIH